MADIFDAVVIGGGPAGYNAAIRLAQLGLRTACIDSRGSFGGTCLNIGCIPSKALLYASELYEATGHHAPLGIKAKPELDLNAMMAHKDKVVGELTKGVEFLFRKNKIEAVVGNARIAAPKKIEVKAKDGSARTLEAANIVVATGSASTDLPGVKIDEKTIVSSTGALSLARVPKRLVVVGAGYIGLELGSVWRRLGSEVTVVEFLDRIAPGLDGEIARTFHRLLQRQGMKFQLASKVSEVAKAGSALKTTIEPAAGGTRQTLEADAVLVCVGRRPYTDGLGLAAVGVALDGRKRIVTDAKYRTNVAGIWAIGDVREGPMLAHKAEDEAVACAENIAGRAGHVNYAAIPSVVYTAPEVASVGATEEDLKAAGIAYRIGKFPFTANPRAKTIAATDGMVKILAEEKTGRVLGVHILGAEAGTMISEAALAIEFGASAEDIARTSHPHPTLSEAVRQAAMAVDGWAMQM